MSGSVAAGAAAEQEEAAEAVKRRDMEIERAVRVWASDAGVWLLRLRPQPGQSVHTRTHACACKHTCAHAHVPVDAQVPARDLCAQTHASVPAVHLRTHKCTLTRCFSRVDGRGGRFGPWV